MSGSGSINTTNETGTLNIVAGRINLNGDIYHNGVKVSDKVNALLDTLSPDFTGFDQLYFGDVFDSNPFNNPHFVGGNAP